MDLSRVKSTKEKLVIVAPERYPHTAVITLIPCTGKSIPTLKVNRKALELMGVSGKKNRLVMFDQFNVSLTETPEYRQVLGVMEDVKVTAEKQHRTYQIHSGTKCVKSKEICNLIFYEWELKVGVSHDFEVIEVEGLPGVFYLEYIKVPNLNSNIEVEVELNKGENIDITEQ